MNAVVKENNEAVEIIGSQGFLDWLEKQQVSLIFSSYQLGKFFLIGRHPPDGISIFQRNFTRCMGITVDQKNDAIYLSTLYQIWKFKNCLPEGDDYQGYDRMYSPQASYLTGDIDVHDMGLMDNGKIVFVNTLFSCLSTHSEDFSFDVFWKPSFISKLAPEDRCHLNGIAMHDGQPVYVSMFSQTNSPNAWREYKKNGGILMDIASNEVVCTGLSMPHSPRIYRDTLWVLNSGTGYLGYVDLHTGKFNEVTFCPGYLRGLKFIGDYALVGSSRLRETNFVATTLLQDNLKKHHQEAQCGIFVINLKTGHIEQKLLLSGKLVEIYDVDILQNIVKPMAIGIENDGIRRIVTIPPSDDTIEKHQLIILENLH